MSRMFKFALAAFTLSAFAPAALAHPGEAVSVRVSYSDLDMSKPADGGALLKRIERAAYNVCGDTTKQDPLGPLDQSKCRRKAIDDAVRNVNIDTLTLAWSGKYPVTSIASR